VVVSSETRFVQAPALCGNVIRPIKAILPPRSDRPVAFYGDLLVAPLVERIVGFQTVREVLSSWSTVQPPERAATLLQWAIQNAIIVRVDHTSRGQE
jgi:hypothetical protein